MKIFAIGIFAFLAIFASSAVAYHFVFLRVIQSGWASLDAMSASSKQDAQKEQERFMRANLDAMARKLGEMQARMMKMESLGERVASLTGVDVGKLPQPGVFQGQGGALVAVSAPVTMRELTVQLDALDAFSKERTDWLTAVEAQLFDEKIRQMMIPTQEPVPGRRTNSGFGRRLDPFTKTAAMHTGLDFAAPTGTPILAAAGGVVVEQRYHPEYGNMVEIDHGNNLVTRYAHASRVWVKRGDLIKRGQEIATVGTTGRSTGAHLHFEVLMNGVWQDPAKFLAQGQGATVAQASSATMISTDAK